MTKLKKKIVTKLKNSDCDRSQKSKLLQNKKKKLQLWQNSKTPIVTKIKKSNYDKTQKLELWQKSKTQIATKVKNSNCDKTQNL